ncbi:MAG: hypothetical protein JXR84_27735 [Anaerolineae bacterium]|nr:hypothetical protein [Anaerolineae bacterium]
MFCLVVLLSELLVLAVTRTQAEAPANFAQAAPLDYAIAYQQPVLPVSAYPAPVMVDGASLEVAAPSSALDVGATFIVMVTLVDAPDRLSAYQYSVSYDPQIVGFFGISAGPYLSGTERYTVCPDPVEKNLSYDEAIVHAACASTGDSPGPAGGVS